MLQPALLTRMSAAPYAACAASAMRIKLAWSRTSRGIGTARRASATISSPVPSNRASSRLVTTRSAPARASARAKLRPSPRLAPVTIATRPDRSNGVSGIAGLQDHLHQVLAPAMQPIEPLRPLLERRDRADERRHVDVAALHQSDRGRVLALRGAGSEERQLASDDILERQAHQRHQVADQRNGATLPYAPNRRLHGPFE